MRWHEWSRRLVALAVVVLVGAGCGGGGGRTGSPVSTAATPTTAGPTTTIATTAPVAMPTFEDMLAKVRAALLVPGKATHVRMDVVTEATAGTDTNDTTVDAWVDPTLPLVRVDHHSGTGTGPDVTILDSESGINPEDPAVVTLLSLLASQPEGSPGATPPGGVTIRPDVLDGRPVVVSEFLFPPVDESEQAQRVSLTFDADGRPVSEIRRPEGGDAAWTKTITYSVDFVDPATLPEDFWQGHDVGGRPPETGAPATDLPPGQGSYSYETADQAAPKVAELAQQGLPVMWLGPEYMATRFGGLMIDYWPSTGASAPVVVGMYYISTGPYYVHLTETTAAAWPTVFPELASVEMTGQPVEGAGGRAFLVRGSGWDMPGFGALVLFRDGAVVMIELGTDGATLAETDAQLIAAAKALQPFPGS